MLLIYFPNSKNKKKVTIKIALKEIYLINNLKIKIFIRINIIKSKKINILISYFIILISSYQIDISIKLKSKEKAIR